MTFVVKLLQPPPHRAPKKPPVDRLAAARAKLYGYDPLSIVAPPPKPVRHAWVTHAELRRFIGDPKIAQWRALLKRTGVRQRGGLSRKQALQVLQTRYSELGERLIRNRAPSLGTHGSLDGA